VSRWQIVVFDLDDTLYPERDFVFSGFRAVAEWAETHLGILYNKGYAELVALYESGVRGDTFNRWLAPKGIAHETVLSQLVQVYRRHSPCLSPFPETPDVLARLHCRYRLGLVSDGRLDVQRHKLVALGLESHFDAVVFSDEWGQDAWKPNVKPFQVVLQRLDAISSAAIYVADNPLKDFLGARQLGMFTVRIQRPGGEYAHLAPPTPQHAPDQTIHCLTELETLLS
jgi:putative hydrolase of the HAD superfamily